MEIEVSPKQQLKVFSHNHNIFVEDADAAYRVSPDNMNKELRDIIALKALTKFKENGGYLNVSKDSENKYNLLSKMRLKGGGPILGWFLYCSVKALAYCGIAVMGAGATAAVTAATGGTATPGILVAGAVAKTAIGATTATALAGTALTGTAVATTAGALTTATVATSGVVGLVSGIEAASCAAFAFGAALPTP